MSDDTHKFRQLRGEGEPPRALAFLRKHRLWFRRARNWLVLFGGGVIVGIWVSGDTPEEVRARISVLETKNEVQRQELAELRKRLTETRHQSVTGQLPQKDKSRHLKRAKAYAKSLRRVKAQRASELITWFVSRWNQLLDRPQPDDRLSRRAALLAQLLGSMGETLNPQDYVAWQSELLDGDWLADLHFDLDKDGLPAPRSAPNTRDGFADMSVCQVGMALNQAVKDAMVLMTPKMRCDRPDVRISVFLSGATLNDALDTFVSAVREQGLLVAEKVRSGKRLILVSPPRR